VPVQFVPYETAGVMADAVRHDAWDLAFLAIDPQRAADIAFTAPYVLIEGAYMVPAASPIHANTDVDREGVRIAVGAKTAYDLFLTREIRHATLVRAASSQAAMTQFLGEGLEAVAGVRQPLVAAASRHPGYRLLHESFMVIRQAAGVPRGRDLALAYVDTFIRTARESGFVATALRESGHAEVTVAA
jgi:polar amino acid transport system substrate-binding protein